MPFRRCDLPSGERGYKWGEQGKCYPTKQQAEEQMRAILASELEKLKKEKK